MDNDITNKKETDILKKYFTDNDALLKAMRALMLGLEITVEEKRNVRSVFKDVELLEIVRQRFLPKINKDAPIGKISDVWLGVETMIFGHSKDTIYQAIQYKQKAIEMTEKALALLENDGEKISIEFNPRLSPLDDLQINLLSRNQYLRHVEGQLLSFKIIAESKEETKEEKAKRETKNSSA